MGDNVKEYNVNIDLTVPRYSADIKVLTRDKAGAAVIFYAGPVGDQAVNGDLRPVWYTARHRRHCIGPGTQIEITARGNNSGPDRFHWFKQRLPEIFGKGERSRAGKGLDIVDYPVGVVEVVVIGYLDKK